MKIINGQKHYTAKEVGMLVGRTNLTVHLWDTWSKELAERGDLRLIPEPLKMGKQKTRYWNEKDISFIDNFAKNIQRGDLAEFSKRQWGKKDPKSLSKKRNISDKKMLKSIDVKKELLMEDKLIYAVIFLLEKESEEKCVSISNIERYFTLELDVINATLQKLVDLSLIIKKNDKYILI